MKELKECRIIGFRYWGVGIALLRQFMNCLYVASDYRAAGIAVNMPILAHIHTINSYVGFERSLNIFANIAKE